MGVATKTVAIVGAGPSGLVAAKNLLRSSRCKFEVSVFEKKASLGGIWAVDRHNGDPLQVIDAEMPTNASHFLVSFSDLAWSSVDLADPKADRPQPRGPNARPFVPLFPKAWQVRKYLVEYAKRYIPDGVITFNRTITRSERTRNAQGNYEWKISWKDYPGLTEQHGVFDYLLVSSGYFSEPNMALSTKLLAAHKPNIKHIHSSKLRCLEDVAPDLTTKGSILVVGGSMSGAEAATTLAFDISNAEHAPSGKTSPDIKVVQIVPKPFYALPPLVPFERSTSQAPKFFALDMALYDLAKRPAGQINPGEGRQPSQISNKSHSFLRTLTGGDQRELGSPSIVANNVDMPASAAVQEMYPEFVRSGAITVKSGRLEAFIQPETRDASNTSPSNITAGVTNAGEETLVDNVIGIVFATGFKTTAGLDFLPTDIKSVLEYDEECNRLPLILGEQSTMHPAIDNLGFVGLYEVPYWGVMEKQAESITHRWAKRHIPGNASQEDSQQEEVDAFQRGRLKVMRDLRQAMMDKAKDIPQYWMGDYVGTIEKLARETGIVRKEIGSEHRTGPVFGARYVSETGDAKEAQKLVDDLLQAQLDSRQKGRFVARATFRAMQGNWRIQRKLDSFLAGYPSGELTGMAAFHPRKPTDDTYDKEYLYIESGMLNTRNGLTLQASRRYVYRYQELSDSITVWFVKEDGKTVDYLYNELVFDPACEDAWLAKSDHLCIKDMYSSEYRFLFQGIHLRMFVIKHSVRGPQKDYISDTSFER